MKAYSLLVGSPNRTRRFSRSHDRLLQAITARHFPEGFTVLDAKGAWHDASRRVFRKEEARQVLVTAGDPRRLKRWCHELGAALGQKELVLVEIGRTTRVRLRGHRQP